MRPIVGINGDVKTDPGLAIHVKFHYVEAVRRAGGIPLVLPAADPEHAAAVLERVDAVVLTGGGDIDTRPRAPLHPSVELMDPRRQAFDMALVELLLARPMPTLGICLGMQQLAYGAGAELIQHLPDAQIPGLLDHRAPHEVEIEEDSHLGRILGVRHARIVSHHHQAIRRAPARFRAVAFAPDGVLEGIEAPGERFLIGVQWHPERAPDAPETERLFRALIESARGVR